MKKVRAKKHLGQHFLKNVVIAEKIVQSLDACTDVIVEVGPGMGILTQFLLKKNAPLVAVEIDSESVTYLQSRFQNTSLEVLRADFLKMDFSRFEGKSISVIGNYPYNISTQIIFKILTHKNQVVQFLGMFQEEVARRICSPHGSKVYGITSVLVQLFYDVEYLFSVSREVFSPPPKVESAVIRFNKKSHLRTDFDQKLLFKIVKMSFNQRRKTLRKSLSGLAVSKSVLGKEIFNSRPEQLSVDDFINLTKLIEDSSLDTKNQ